MHASSREFKLFQDAYQSSTSLKTESSALILACMHKSFLLFAKILNVELYKMLEIVQVALQNDINTCKSIWKRKEERWLVRLIT
jgi:hypothetical protein